MSKRLGVHVMRVPKLVVRIVRIVQLVGIDVKRVVVLRMFGVQRPMELNGQQLMVRRASMWWPMVQREQRLVVLNERKQLELRGQRLLELSEHKQLEQRVLRLLELHERMQLVVGVQYL